MHNQSTAHERCAAQLSATFTHARASLEAILDRHNGVMPMQSEHDEAIMRLTSKMIGAVSKIHNMIGEAAELAGQHNPYSEVCAGARTQLGRFFNKYDGPLYAGQFHDNVWVLVSTFLHEVDTAKLAPSTAMTRAAECAAAEAAKKKSAARPAARRHTARQSAQVSGLVHQAA